MAPAAMLLDNTPRHVARTAPRILFSSKESIASRLARKEVDRGRHALSGYRAPVSRADVWLLGRVRKQHRKPHFY
jgi:hypothetical protein